MVANESKLRRTSGPTSASRLVVRAGAILMCRRGPVKMVGQSGTWVAARAPESRGLWAFPWPYYDEYFAHHKWDEVLPKQLTKVAIGLAYDALADDRVAQQALNEKLWAERAAWIKANQKVQPIHRFWWSGDVYARFGPRGMADADGWFLLPMGVYLAQARRVEPRGSYASRDHMEVFLALGRGRLLGKDPNAR